MYFLKLFLYLLKAVFLVFAPTKQQLTNHGPRGFLLYYVSFTPFYRTIPKHVPSRNFSHLNRKRIVPQNMVMLL